MNEKDAKAVPAKVVKKATKAIASVADAAMTAPAAIATAIVDTVKTAPAPVQAPITQEGQTMTDTVTNVADKATSFAKDQQDKAAAMFSDWNGRTKSAMERSTKLFEELNEFNKGNIEAMVESSRVAAKAAETLGQQAAENARKSFEQATAAIKTLASVKTPTELFQLQSDMARSAFDQAIADASKNSEMMLKLVGDVFQPISNRFAVAAEKIKTAA